MRARWVKLDLPPWEKHKNQKIVKDLSPFSVSGKGDLDRQAAQERLHSLRDMEAG